MPKQDLTDAEGALPTAVYYRPILRALIDLGDQASRRDVLNHVYGQLTHRLAAVDREIARGVEPRWKHRVDTARYRLVERGLISNGTAPGTWRITRQGRQELDICAAA